MPYKFVDKELDAEVLILCLLSIYNGCYQGSLKL